MASQPNTSSSAVPASVLEAVLVSSAEATLPEGALPVKGYAPGPALPQGGFAVDWEKMFQMYATTGYQAASLADAVAEVNRMIKWRLADDPIEEDEADEWKDPALRARHRCTIFLGYTSNLVSAGVRELICFLVKNAMVDAIVASAGGVEEDFIKCLAPTYTGAFHLPGAELRKKGLNRIGNLLQPNDNYCKFEDWVMPLFDKMLKLQNEKGVHWSPSRVIHYLGRAINHEESIYYWCYRNNIPVFCPALTDGSLGDMLYMHSFRNEVPLRVDIVSDLRRINSMAAFAKKTGMIILGGGVVKHHICNANLMRNGADFAVFINTGQEFDGSDAGARPDEAVSWGKIRAEATPVKIYADATLIFPILVALTFAKTWQPKDLEAVRKNNLYHDI